MRIHFVLIIFFCSTLFISHDLMAQDLANLKNEVEKILEFDYSLHFEEGEGLWLGVIDGDSTFIFKVGNMIHDSLINFQVGSVSKIFTAELINAALAKKNLSTSDKISNHLELHKEYGEITFDQLITHRSNLPKDPYFFGRHNKNPDNPYESYPDSLIVPELNRYSELYQPENLNEFNYGNLNYALLGLLTERIEEKDYCELIKEKYQAQFPSIRCSDRADSLSFGFDKAGQLGYPWDFPGFAPSEGLSMNVIDLTNYVRSEFEKQSEFESIKISKNLYHEAPWYIIKQKRNREIYSFSGTTSIHSVFVCMNKENKTAVVMMRNSGKGILHLPLTILSMVDDTKKKNK